jgi:hypothetical protein
MKRTLLLSAVTLCFSSVAVLADDTEVMNAPKVTNLTSSINMMDSFVAFEPDMKKSPSQEKFTRETADYSDDSDDEAETVKTKISQQNNQKTVSTEEVKTGFWGTGFGKFLTSVWTTITSCFRK